LAASFLWYFGANQKRKNIDNMAANRHKKEVEEEKEKEEDPSH
jgi:hypothetical protein